MEFSDEICNIIYDAINDTMISKNDLKNCLEVPKDKSNGDLSLPCFKLAKVMKKSPNQIADDIKNNIETTNTVISKIDNVNGFLNFYISNTEVVSRTISKFATQKQDYGKSDMGNGKTVLVEFSSPNIAKPFHIGHLKTTIIGNALFNIYKFLGYHSISINHLGDYGTQFAKLIVAYEKWGTEYDLTEDPIEKLSEMYVRINQLCEEDESILNLCRDTFKKLESKDPKCMEIWQKFRDYSLAEFDKIYELLNIHFDSTKGEAFYADKIDEVVDRLEASGKLIDSEGAKIIDLTEDGIDTPCIVKKANGSSIYATRDLSAILYRIKTYDFYKCIYVVGNEQSLYFKQLFAVAKYLGIDEKYQKGLEHVGYGMIRLPEGKMSSRKGNFIKVKDLLDDSISKVEEIMKERDLNYKDVIAKQIGVGAIIFEDLKDSRIKDQVFDLKEALNFNGETGPYIQYTTVRTNSVLEKAGYIPNENEINTECLTDESSLQVIKTISKFQNIIISAMEKSEPSYIARYLLELSKKYSNFYNSNKIICDNKEKQNARLYLTYMTNLTLKNGLGLLGIEVPNKM